MKMKIIFLLMISLFSGVLVGLRVVGKIKSVKQIVPFREAKAFVLTHDGKVILFDYYADEDELLVNNLESLSKIGLIALGEKYYLLFLSNGILHYFDLQDKKIIDSERVQDFFCLNKRSIVIFKENNSVDRIVFAFWGDLVKEVHKLDYHYFSDAKKMYQMPHDNRMIVLDLHHITYSDESIFSVNILPPLSVLNDGIQVVGYQKNGMRDSRILGGTVRCAKLKRHYKELGISSFFVYWGCDHLFFTNNFDLIKKISRLAVEKNDIRVIGSDSVDDPTHVLVSFESGALCFLSIKDNEIEEEFYDNPHQGIVTDIFFLSSGFIITRDESGCAYVWQDL